VEFSTHLFNIDSYIFLPGHFAGAMDHEGAEGAKGRG
jgi:hypothetical protein